MATISTPENGRKSNRAERRYKGDRTRRRRWFTQVNTCVAAGVITLECAGWLLRLAEQSSDTMKPVWGKQTKQAKNIGKCERMVRNYRKMAEIAGLIETKGAPIERDSQGRISRIATNLYVFLVPKAIRRKSAGLTERQSDAALIPDSSNQIETLRKNHSLIIDEEPDYGSEPALPPWKFWRQKRANGA